MMPMTDHTGERKGRPYRRVLPMTSRVTNNPMTDRNPRATA